MKQNAQLTKREWQVATLLAWGAIKKEIADELCVSIHTIENHVRNIYEKTEVKNSSQLSAWYFCKKYDISMKLSPLKNIVAAILLTIYISGDITGSCDNFTRTRNRTRSTHVIRRRYEG